MKNLTLGTPNTLSEAIAQGLTSGPISQIHESVELAVKDFIRQILCIQFMNNGDNEQIMNVLYRLEAQLGCKMSELEIKRIENNLKNILADALGVKAGGE
jgi:hypothetical protein